MITIIQLFITNLRDRIKEWRERDEDLYVRLDKMNGGGR